MPGERSEPPAVSAEPPWHALPRTPHRRAFTLFGLFVQLVGVAMPVAYIAGRTEQTQAVITKSTVLLVGHQVVHTRDGVVVLVAAALMFTVGSVLLARPYVRSWLTLLVGVPVAAVAGLLVLGVGALVVALIVFVILNDLDLPDFSSDRRRKRRLRR